MTETLHQNSDVPNFDTYPYHPSAHPEPLPAEGVPNDTALIHRAQQVGAALGRTVSTLRNAGQRLQELGSETAETAATRLGNVIKTARARAHELGQATATRASELGESVAEKAGQLGRQAKAGYFQARRGANRISRDYPLHVVVAAGAVGILMGIGIRIWRASRAY
jgi:ElaB/YqjD/DUF883 family membrane-anchored ribosome-binding protein